jgi:peptidoglycan/LPS O-acetylase OafA/YrhL
MASSLGFIRLPQIAFADVFLFLLITPLIKRNKIPRVKTAEKIGKRSYGLYLTHLIVIDLTLVLIETLVPGFLGWPLILVPLLFALGVGVPVLTMEKLAKMRKLRPIYPYIFG